MLTIDLDRLALRPGMVVLDLGCGEGRHAAGVLQGGAGFVVGADMDQGALRSARQRLADLGMADAGWLCCDGRHVPLQSGAFDRVICSEMLEHVVDHDRVLQELDRLLSLGGLLAVTVPSYWPEKVCWWLSVGYQQQPGGHVKIFRRHDLRRQIEALGLEYLGGHRAHALHTPYWWLQCLFWDRRERSAVVRWYHRLLVWDMFKKPALTQWFERLANPVLGKSLVLYFRKPGA